LAWVATPKDTPRESHRFFAVLNSVNQRDKAKPEIPRLELAKRHVLAYKTDIEKHGSELFGLLHLIGENPRKRKKHILAHISVKEQQKSPRNGGSGARCHSKKIEEGGALD
jgi:hypothetical protein